MAMRYILSNLAVTYDLWADLKALIRGSVVFLACAQGKKESHHTDPIKETSCLFCLETLSTQKREA